MTKKYFVTFCALDHQFEGNIFWHSCLLLSQSETGSKMKVVDNWGFYGLPATTRDTWTGKIKIKLGLDVDFNNHGMLRHEDTRYLEAGYGLHGVTFELSQEKFDELQQRCQKMASEQEAAIHEIVDPLAIDGKSPGDERIYSHEHLSQSIYRIEIEKAKLRKSVPRLKPFEVNPTFTMWGLAVNQSKTCKTQSIGLLTGILTPEQIARLTENGKHPTVPRYSGKMENIYLHSNGSLRTHKRASGKIVHYRDAKKDKDVEVYWTLPPQEIEALSAETKKSLSVSAMYCDEIKAVIEKLQKLEWLFINAVVPDNYRKYLDRLIDEIRRRYNQFAMIESGEDNSLSNGWYEYALGLFSLPRNNQEKRDFMRLYHTKEFISRLYIAMADGWEMADDEDCEIEAITTYLSMEDKKSLCAIIGRSYVEPSSSPKMSV